MACVKYGQAKMVIAVDMSDMIYDAMAIAKYFDRYSIISNRIIFYLEKIISMNRKLFLFMEELKMLLYRLKK